VSPPLARALGDVDRETLLGLLAPDGEDRWDATEYQARTRALLVALRRSPVAHETVDARAALAMVERVEAAARALPAEAWPAQRAEIVFGGITVQIGTTGADTFDTALTLDPGGDDRYDIRSPAPSEVHLDLAGNDVWTGVSGTLGGTVGGVSILVDDAGDDTYRSMDGDTPGNASLGAGVLGVGILVDRAGNDSYRAGATTQGAGFAGIGLLLDAGGADTYDATGYAQGYAGVLGVGALWDGGGDDMYRAGGAYPDMPSRLPEHTLSLSQGFSIGLRPDAGGGLGLLVDDGGNDAYVADLFGQGCSYWFSRGYLVDRAGNDRYGMYQYGQGSGIHLSVGGLFDLAGNDAYTGGNIVQGSSHDLSVGWLVDRAGDDIYAANSTAQGGSLTNSATFFYDGAGDDAYVFGHPYSRGWGRFDRNRGAIGVFVDGSGTDKYDGAPGNDAVARPWAYGVAVDGAALLPPPDPEGPLPAARVLRDPDAAAAAAPSRPAASAESLADLARADSVDCKVPKDCEQYRSELAKGGPDTFARLLLALPRDVLAEEYTLDALLAAMRSPANDPELHDLLLARLADGPSYPAERWMVRWLGQLGVDPAGTTTALERLVKDGDPLLREAIATAILTWKTAPPLLDRLATDPEPGVRAVAALALGAGGAAPERLTPMLLDPSVLVRFDAADALLARPPETIRAALLVSWRAGAFPTPATRRLVLELLTRVGGKEAGAVIAAVAAADADPWAQRKAKLALAGAPPFPWRPQ
jgi:HEAT repeat protein